MMILLWVVYSYLCRYSTCAIEQLAFSIRLRRQRQLPNRQRSPQCMRTSSKPHKPYSLENLHILRLNLLPYNQTSHEIEECLSVSVKSWSHVFNVFLILFAIDVAHDTVCHRASLNRVSVVYNNVTFLTECLQSSYNINMLWNVSHKFECSDTVGPGTVCSSREGTCVYLQLPTDVRYVRMYELWAQPDLALSCGTDRYARPCFVSPRRQGRCGLYSRPGNRYYFLPLLTI